MSFLVNLIHDEYGRNMFHAGVEFDVPDDGTKSYKAFKHGYEDEKKLHEEGKCYKTSTYSSVLL